MSLKVVHLSPTPLVASPGKIAAALRRINIDATSVVLADYPKGGPLANKFIDHSLVWTDGSKEIVALIHDRLLTADIIHVHNDLPIKIIEYLRENCTSARFVYQVHSPLREGPLYGNRAEYIGLPFSAYLSVAQYHPRQYPTFQPVPNIVLEEPSIQLRRDGEPLRVLFSPSHTRSGRWNAKYSARLDDCIKHLKGLGQIEVVWPEQPLHPTLLMALRRTCHASIDEIMTGAFHQVSLEGMCAGNVVINRADYFSKALLAQCTETFAIPPFLFADESTIDSVMLSLSANEEQTRRQQQASVNYFANHLVIHKMAERYHDIYKSII